MKGFKSNIKIANLRPSTDDGIHNTGVRKNKTCVKFVTVGGTSRYLDDKIPNIIPRKQKNKPTKNKFIIKKKIEDFLHFTFVTLIMFI